MWSILKAVLVKLGVLRGLIAVLGSLSAVLVFAAIKVGIAMLKFLLFAALATWLAWKVAKWASRRRDDGEPRAPEAPPPAAGAEPAQ